MFKLNTYTIKATNSLTTIKKYVDTTITKRNTSILTIKNLTNSSPSAQEWLTSNYQTLIDYIKTKVSSNQLNVVTVSEWYNNLTNPHRTSTSHTSV